MSGERKTTHGNHYVAQGYLKNFADNKRVYVIPFDKGERPGLKHIRNVAKERDLYTFEDTDVFSEIDKAEQMLGKVETKAHPILESICAGNWRLMRTDRETLARYFALQLTRGPEVEARYKNFIDLLESRRPTITGVEDIKEIFDSYEGAWFPQADPSLVWENMQKDEFSFRADMKFTYIRDIFLTAEEIMKTLLVRPWRFIFFEENALFTSDSPMSPFVKSDERAQGRFTVEGADGILVPLSPRLALMMGQAISPHVLGPLISWMGVAAGRADSRIRGTAENAAEFNRMTRDSAYRYLYRHPDDAHLDPGPLPEPTLLR
ncbi:DUF4238 domain-containing protein [Micrococcus luteus]|uniref:DUF4238 domain-containing protein n=1 Tax=Micrococcus luteus TaxID=1270 RepID=UPI0039A3E6C7